MMGFEIGQVVSNPSNTEPERVVLAVGSAEVVEMPAWMRSIVDRKAVWVRWTDRVTVSFDLAENLAAWANGETR